MPQEESPWDRAGLATKYSLSFVLPLLRFAWNDDLQLERLARPPKEDESKLLGEQLEKNYQIECLKTISTRQETKRRRKRKSRKPSLIRALFRTFGLELLVASLFKILPRNFLMPLQTLSLGWLLEDIRRYSDMKTIDRAFSSQSSSEATTTTTTMTNETLRQMEYQVHDLANDGADLARAHQKILVDVGILVATTCLSSCLLHPFFFQTYHIGMKCRIAACHLIYMKALKLSQLSLSGSTGGQMTSLLSNDVQRFDLVVQAVPSLIDGPICVLLVTWILARYYLGLYATASGLVVIVLLMLVQGSLGKLFWSFRLRASKQADKRFQLTSEIIKSIQVLKMYAWERPFERWVAEARREELKEVRNTFVVRALNFTTFFISSKLIVFTMLMVYIQLGCGSLTPQLVFVTIGLCNLVRFAVTMHLANAFALCAETLISLKRINEFLQLPEIQSARSAIEAAPAPATDSHCSSTQQQAAITFERAYAWWTSKEQIVLRNLSLTIRKGELVFVVGRVASGKSSVLMSILGELPLVSGTLRLSQGSSSRLSFAAQEACLFAGTVRNNILFGNQYKPERYREVIKACCLEREFAQVLPSGDQTIVGERGASLSGGQKARINLARALYHEADIYLLDDPLSAVDGPVARHLVEQCLSRSHGFLADKTVLIATHQMQFLERADRVLLIDQQAPPLFGTPDEVLRSAGFKLVGYAQEAFLVCAASSGREAEGEEEQSNLSGDEEGARTDPALAFRTWSRRASERLARKAPREPKTSAIDDSALASTTTKDVTVARDEDESSGVARNATTYLFYLWNSFRPLGLICFVCLLLLSNTIQLWIDYQLSRWTNAREQRDTLGEELYKPKNFIDRWSLEQLFLYYGLSIVCGILATLAVCLTFMQASVRASRRLHSNALSRLLNAKMSWFASTSIGLILNRMSRDLGFVDQVLPFSALEIIIVLSHVATIIVLTIMINIYNSLVVMCLLLVAITLRWASSRAISRLKQLDGITRSPVFAHLASTLNGLATIRAFKQEARFRAEFDEYQDGHSSAWFAFMSTTRWLSQAMDWSSVTFVSTVVLVLILFQLDSVSASLIGLLISNAINMPSLFHAGIRLLVDAESQLISVQRIKELCELEPERSGGDGAKAIEDNTNNKRRLKRLKSIITWHPNDGLKSIQSSFKVPAGCIKFVGVSLSYLSDLTDPSKLVLRHLNLTIRPREKVGIVGRTGAGKSSIIAVLFRLYDFSGRIEIDGRDTRAWPLNDLRRSISIIPQDPVLFAGSLRKNLDPFGAHSDAELWHAIEAVSLKGLIMKSENDRSGEQAGLEFQISEAGANFSVGQRQLICLARAIVRRNKILVLDEATANVDPEMDAFIQRTIAQQFVDCTVLTIAHRIITIVESDRVLVLDRGQVSEFDEPYQLLERPNGAFKQIVDSCEQQAPLIKKLIREAHERKRKN